jgi:hypothetical protein
MHIALLRDSNPRRLKRVHTASRQLSQPEYILIT